jgi:hypothetical protein
MTEPTGALMKPCRRIHVEENCTARLEHSEKLPEHRFALN